MRETYTTTFNTMSTTLVVTSVGITRSEHDAAIEGVKDDITLWHTAFNRFRPESTISRLNAAQGEWVEVEDAFLDLLLAARDGVTRTNGRFNPAMLPALDAAGYRGADLADDLTLTPASSWDEIEIDGNTVRLPVGMAIDFGGIAKGALADRIADRHRDWPGGVVSIGGDMRVWGVAPEAALWRVGIENPMRPSEDITALEITDTTWRAIATSSLIKRSWTSGSGERMHHIIDPATGYPAISPLAQITVAADSAIDAEIACKNLIMQSTHLDLSPDDLSAAHWAIAVTPDERLLFLNRQDTTHGYAIR